MKTIKLVALDLDGTLLNEQSQISEVNRQAVIAATQAGAKVVIDTGRPHQGAVQEFLTQLQLQGAGHYTINYNGSQVTENNGNILWQNLLVHDEILQIAEIAKKFQLPVDFITSDYYYTIGNGKPSLTHYINDAAVLVDSSLTELPKDKDYYKAIVSAKKVEMDRILPALLQEFSASFEAVRTCAILVEIMKKNVTKASGLNALCQHLQISSDEVLAMGDGGNDVSMLKWAGLGVSPANAGPAARAAADVISEYTNEENAVAKVIEQYVL